MQEKNADFQFIPIDSLLESNEDFKDKIRKLKILASNHLNKIAEHKEIVRFIEKGIESTDDWADLENIIKLCLELFKNKKFKLEIYQNGIYFGLLEEYCIETDPDIDIATNMFELYKMNIKNNNHKRVTNFLKVIPNLIQFERIKEEFYKTGMIKIVVRFIEKASSNIEQVLEGLVEIIRMSNVDNLVSLIELNLFDLLDRGLTKHIELSGLSNIQGGQEETEDNKSTREQKVISLKTISVIMELISTIVKLITFENAYLGSEIFDSQLFYTLIFQVNKPSSLYFKYEMLLVIKNLFDNIIVVK